ncbi:MAG: hypothetical protein HY340_02735 [Candidatus Kerfeldbacteria bacterium]|nr:hypothetical protein [Candidatus Kerfeldbacteria bacterium]
MIEFEVLSAIRGHTTMYIEDVDPAKRTELATTVTNLLNEGHVIFLIQGEETRRIQGYDADANEWLVLATPSERKAETRMQSNPSLTTSGFGMGRQRRSARGTRATAISRTAGG